VHGLHVRFRAHGRSPLDARHCTDRLSYFRAGIPARLPGRKAADYAALIRPTAALFLVSYWRAGEA
jgi:hypothetical protein